MHALVWSKKVFAMNLRAEAGVFCLILFLCSYAGTQTSAAGKPSTAAVKADLAKDALGRTTPRGTVMGFLVAAQKKQYEIGSEYLNTRLRDKAAITLAYQLAVVLDTRLPAKLNQLSDVPEGSLSLLRPDQDIVGTITSAKGNVDILLERVDRADVGPVWLFSSKTLEAIPGIYDELDTVNIDAVLPGFLVHNQLFGIVAYEWLVVFVGIPLFYFLAVRLNHLLSPFAGWIWRRVSKKSDASNPHILSTPIRLFLLALTIRWLISQVSLPLLARQFWSSVSVVVAIVATVWSLILISGHIEKYLLRRFSRQNLSAAGSILRLTRRVINLLILFAGVLLTLYYFGVNPTAALAGLGVGGIAVALAAQKTLENVIGGVSLMVDKALQVGDTLKVGDTCGTVEEIGLRSTRIRTFERTLVTVPNGQIANVSLETISARDKFCFHPVVGLRYGTTAEQMSAVIGRVHDLLATHIQLEQDSVRVRFLGFGSSSLDLDLFAYVYARDWNHFLEIQEGLLLQIMKIVQETGAQIALPSQITYLTRDRVGHAAQLRTLQNGSNSESLAQSARKSA